MLKRRLKSPKNVRASAGTGGVEADLMTPWDHIVTTGLSIIEVQSTASPIGRFGR